MTTMLHRAFLSTCVLFAASSTAWADPLDLSTVAAGAKWLIHLDVDDIRGTDLAREVQNHVIQTEDEGRLDWVQERYGIDLRVDLHGLTFYGRGYAPHEGVALLHSAHDPAKLVAVVADQPQYQTARHGEYTIHSWRAGQRGQQRDVAMAFFDPDTVVFAGSTEQAQMALDVLSGRHASLEDEPQPLLTGELPAGSFFRGSAIGLQDLKMRDERFGMLRQAERMAISLAENGPLVSLQAEAVAVSEEVARQLAGAVREFARATTGGNPGTRGNPGGGQRPQLPGQLQVEQSGTTIVVNWEMERQEVVELLQKSLKAARNARRPDGARSK